MSLLRTPSIKVTQGLLRSIHVTNEIRWWRPCCLHLNIISETNLMQSLSWAIPFASFRQCIPYAPH